MLCIWSWDQCTFLCVCMRSSWVKMWPFLCVCVYICMHWFVCVCQCFSVFVSTCMSSAFSPLSCEMSTTPSNGGYHSVVRETQLSCDMHAIYSISATAVWNQSREQNSITARGSAQQCLTTIMSVNRWESVLPLRTREKENQYSMCVCLAVLTVTHL